MKEIERLCELIPDRWQSVVSIAPSVDPKSPLIKSQRIDRHQCKIYIDLRQWQAFDLGLRNLLFWHELTRIQNGSIYSDRSTAVTLIAAALLFVIDVPAQNIGVAIVALTIAGLAGFKLYQDRWGERYLRQLTTADRAAIELAVEFGYDCHQACELLRSAISRVRVQSPTDRSTAYAARLIVLSATDRHPV